eukprot:EG_transcript_35799
MRHEVKDVLLGGGEMAQSELHHAPRGTPQHRTWWQVDRWVSPGSRGAPRRKLRTPHPVRSGAVGQQHRDGSSSSCSTNPSASSSLQTKTSDRLDQPPPPMMACHEVGQHRGMTSVWLGGGYRYLSLLAEAKRR